MVNPDRNSFMPEASSYRCDRDHHGHFYTKTSSALALHRDSVAASVNSNGIIENGRAVAQVYRHFPSSDSQD
ncbi:hypothetical protein DOTSEDRAFT_47191 [Dothistroma septosporum NZE10]|uniref:Uncharacterized protein n=1 Tax=Dothistroma septosporum (strain NZE10 / CBS 128990) TaxID=675120 RepID=N1PHZ2_DOTSN|nr:hypothetical protein DOTSEDRAFT_47191 [Dothistroma septosporum NZE10]